MNDYLISKCKRTIQEAQKWLDSGMCTLAYFENYTANAMAILKRFTDEG
jgi:hypothetical protein